MKEEPILVGMKKKKGSSLGGISKEDDDYCLASANEIFISDEMIYQRIFNPLTVPRKSLKDFYKVCLNLRIICT